jgi:hypothetical protein
MIQVKTSEYDASQNISLSTSYEPAQCANSSLAQGWENYYIQSRSSLWKLFIQLTQLLWKFAYTVMCPGFRDW